MYVFLDDNNIQPFHHKSILIQLLSNLLLSYFSNFILSKLFDFQYWISFILGLCDENVYVHFFMVY
jgi:hypothetical protein